MPRAGHPVAMVTAGMMTTAPPQQQIDDRNASRAKSARPRVSARGRFPSPSERDSERRARAVRVPSLPYPPELHEADPDIRPRRLLRRLLGGDPR
jgi:hypothetical protein